LAPYPALKETHIAYASLAAVFAFAGITLVLATPSALSFVSLSDKFAAATTEAQRSQLLAAGEPIWLPICGTAPEPTSVPFFC